MPALNFKARFAGDVESGRKRCTIHARRKRPTRVGDTLYLYTGMRTKACRRLRTVECAAVVPIVIEHRRIYLNGRPLLIQQRRDLAREDGFVDLGAFHAFFEDAHGPVFEGDLIKW